MEDNIKILLTEEEVDTRIRELGEQISAQYAGESVHLICVLKGGVFFMCELAKRISVPDVYKRQVRHRPAGAGWSREFQR